MSFIEPEQLCRFIIHGICLLNMYRKDMKRTFVAQQMCEKLFQVLPPPHSLNRACGVSRIPQHGEVVEIRCSLSIGLLPTLERRPSRLQDVEHYRRPQHGLSQDWPDKYNVAAKVSKLSRCQRTTLMAS